jgi:pyridoxamine 5'-phosphate oxidase-like protein
VAGWGEIEAAAPALGRAVRERMGAHRHATLATLRADGSPRISGIETDFREGELWLGMMTGSRKALDLLRDPRMALHSGTEDPEPSPAAGSVIDATIAGRAVEVADPEVPATFATEPGQRFHLFRIDVAEALLIAIGDPPDHLLIDVWREGRGVRRLRRA